MSEPTQAESYLNTARAHRASGNLDACILAASVAAYHAERDHQPETLYHAHACVGRAHLHRNECEEARGWYRNASEVACMFDLDRYAPSLHDLFLCYRDTEPKIAGRIADKALSHFGSGHHLLRRFKADLAVFNGSMECRWAQFSVLLIPEYDDETHAIALCNLMEVAAYAGEVAQLLALWDSLESVLNRSESREGAAVALLTAAKALARPETAERAFQAALWCAEIAGLRGEDRIADEARFVLSNVN